MSTARRMIQQGAFIAQPSLTEKNLPDQTGKVHIVTGGYSGVGQELAKIIYSKNATIYIAGRSEQKGMESIEAIKASYPSSNGHLRFLHLDLSDLSTIKKSAEEFLNKEERLDVLTNNAGIMTPPKGSKDAQGYDLQIGTNCLGPFLFTSFLVPLLKKTAANSPPGSVRITWAASSAVELSKKGGVEFEADGTVKLYNNPTKDYSQSKAGNVLLALETARRYGPDGIISVAFNPGNLKSELQRHVGQLLKWVLDNVMMYPPVFGAYTELFAGWSEDITMGDNGAYIVPWGQIGELRPDIEAGRRRVEEGGSGTAERFWEWCVKSSRPYV